MGIFLTKDVKKIQLGSSEVLEIYLGNTMVWPVGVTISHIPFKVKDEGSGEYVSFKAKAY